MWKEQDSTGNSGGDSGGEEKKAEGESQVPKGSAGDIVAATASRKRDWRCEIRQKGLPRSDEAEESRQRHPPLSLENLQESGNSSMPGCLATKGLIPITI